MKLPTEEFRKIMEEEKERRKKDIEVEKERKKVEKEREKAENKARREEEKAVKKIERDRVINWNGLEVNNYCGGYVFLQILRLEVDKVTFAVFFPCNLVNNFTGAWKAQGREETWSNQAKRVE